jgi:cytosine permease
MTLKFAFGSVGAKVIAAILSLDMFCWFALNTEIFGSSVRSTVTTVVGMHLSKPALIIVAGIVITLVTIFGYRSVEKLAFLAVPLLSGILVSYFVYNLASTSFAAAMVRPPLSKSIAYATAISIVSGSYLNLSVLLPDFTRYAKNGWHAAVAVLVGICLGLPVVVLLACYLTAATGESDFIKLMLIRGWGLAAIFVIAVTCWKNMNSCLYSASLNLASIIRHTPKWKLTVIAGIGGTIVALVGIADRYVSFLILLSIIVPPITGVYTADYLSRKKLYESAELDLLDRWRPLSLVALAAGISLGFATSPRDAMGLGLVRLTGLPAIDTFIGSFLSLWALQMLRSVIKRRTLPVPSISG